MGTDWLQWPAMLVTVLGAWWTASQTSWKRAAGFWIFLASNVLWAIWGWYADAPATVVLQGFLAVLNWRGASKNQESSTREAGSRA